ncbi:homeobox-leucine zipper protein HOX17-like [Panicum miliaceum]|uniref:Homeobox-leucine zipper protein HOX17-like n=1 Tax=Panicum miliaceum TaxID=4540 RepID=A0A3L6PUE6_PANMI|nr:homeobox-leucine zipper protein HOX17-like [Panicum miliaceum]
MERAEDLGLSLSLSSSLAAAPRTHHVAAMLLRSPGKRFLEMPLLPAKRSEVTAEDGLRGGSDEEDGGCGIDGSRKKLRLSKDQAAVLEDSFREHPTLNPRQKAALAQQLGLRPRQVEVWFQNRRARTKLKQTEVDCEFLKRCCETLTEENRRLQKEVQELRALKLVSPHLYMHMSPPTTLTMCPSCERVSSSASSSAAASTDRRAAGAVISTAAAEGAAVCHRPIAVRPQQS